MHVDGAYTWFRRTHPTRRTWVALPELGHQRQSRTDIHPLRWYDRWPLVRDGRDVRGEAPLASIAGVTWPSPLTDRYQTFATLRGEASLALPRIELADWEAVLRHGFAHADFERWLQAGTARARFYAAISRHTRDWARGRRGERWHSADALAMALALAPGAALEMAERPLVVELAGSHARGATLVDWERQSGRPDNAAILMRYDQVRFEALVEAALAMP